MSISGFYRKQPTSGFFNPNLTISGQNILYIGNQDIRFLGLPIDLSISSTQVKQDLSDRLKLLLQSVDTQPLEARQKLKIFKMATCPRISWSLYTTEIPLTWIERTLETLATRYLKKWLKLSYCAAPRFYISQQITWVLSMPSTSTKYKTLQISRFYSLMCSQDNRVRRLVNHKTSVNKEDNHHKFRSSASTASLLQDVTAVGNNGNNAKHQMTSTIQLQDTNKRIDHLQSCVVQGSVF